MVKARMLKHYNKSTLGLCFKRITDVNSPKSRKTSSTTLEMLGILAKYYDITDIIDNFIDLLMKHYISYSATKATESRSIKRIAFEKLNEEIGEATRPDVLLNSINVIATMSIARQDSDFDDNALTERLTFVDELLGRDGTYENEMCNVLILQAVAMDSLDRDQLKGLVIDSFRSDTAMGYFKSLEPHEIHGYGSFEEPAMSIEELSYLSKHPEHMNAPIIFPNGYEAFDSYQLVDINGAFPYSKNGKTIYIPPFPIMHLDRMICTYFKALSQYVRHTDGFLKLSDIDLTALSLIDALPTNGNIYKVEPHWSVQYFPSFNSLDDLKWINVTESDWIEAKNHIDKMSADLTKLDRMVSWDWDFDKECFVVDWDKRYDVDHIWLLYDAIWRY